MVPHSGGLCGAGEVSGAVWTRERLARACSQALADLALDPVVLARLPETVRARVQDHMALLAQRNEREGKSDER